ncbi:chromate efflux transporter [Candidatus Methylacidithermus pantelleriae]|uniref:Chromate transporter n=1 Tax=Candidatus Methylacidithermus pantelleriae TaxID=2744239 RepID=A0A8J2BL90_9BACT|nr:chromate efflux transporter [Candidatus Methylacidithermus pantelleriae]CAF0702343.1 Chromate transporter [Candidatus Methylacidithermus pantelleriae]
MPRQPLSPPIGRSFARVREVAQTFLLLGSLAFGGPFAHVALMEQWLVKRFQWVSAEEFLQLLGAASLLPGPTSTELAMYLGARRAGILGLVVAGVCFLFPSALLVTFFAWSYVHAHTLPFLQDGLFWVRPAVLVVLVQAIEQLAPKACPTVTTLLLAAAAFGAEILGTGEPWVLLGTGLAAVAIKRISFHRKAHLFCPWVWILAFQKTPWLPLAQPAKSTLFFLFLKIGAIAFGSGYVLIGFLQTEFVHRHHWLTERHLLDAIAVGQITPGPVFTTATFIGFLLNGLPGALLGTAGIFLPSFLYVATTRRLLDLIEKNDIACDFLEGIRAASFAIITAATVSLTRSALAGPISLTIFLLVATLVWLVKINVNLLLSISLAAGILISLLRTIFLPSH